MITTRSTFSALRDPSAPPPSAERAEAAQRESEARLARITALASSVALLCARADAAASTHGPSAPATAAAAFAALRAATPLEAAVREWRERLPALSGPPSRDVAGAESLVRRAARTALIAAGGAGAWADWRDAELRDRHVPRGRRPTHVGLAEPPRPRAVPPPVVVGGRLRAADSTVLRRRGVLLRAAWEERAARCARDFRQGRWGSGGLDATAAAAAAWRARRATTTA